jgi:hypothetical protein
VERGAAHTGVYLAVGDRLLGGTVTAIIQRLVSVALDGRERQLAKAEDFSLTPLYRSAGYLTGQRAAGPQAASQPGQTRTRGAIAGGGSANPPGPPNAGFGGQPAPLTESGGDFAGPGGPPGPPAMPIVVPMGMPK